MIAARSIAGGLVLATACVHGSSGALSQMSPSEARLGNVIVECADLPEQVLRRLAPCQDYYLSLFSERGSEDAVLPDPLVALDNGMVFRCSDLGAAAARIPACWWPLEVGQAPAE